MSLTLTPSGDFDLSTPLPPDWEHLRHWRVPLTCRALEIEYHPAIDPDHPTPEGCPPSRIGHIVPTDRADEIMDRIQQIEGGAGQRLSRQHITDSKRFLKQIILRCPSIPLDEARAIAIRATNPSYGKIRVGLATPEQGADDPVLGAVISHIRHTHTSYDRDLRRFNRTMTKVEAHERARQIHAGAITRCFLEWNGEQS